MLDAAVDRASPGAGRSSRSSPGRSRSAALRRLCRSRAPRGGHRGLPLRRRGDLLPRGEKVVGEETGEWLRSFRFSGDLDAYAEGECYFPGARLSRSSRLSAKRSSSRPSCCSPQLRLRRRRRCLRMVGRRRSPGDRDGLTAHARARRGGAARAAYVAGAASTSNLEAGSATASRPPAQRLTLHPRPPDERERLRRPARRHGHRDNAPRRHLRRSHGDQDRRGAGRERGAGGPERSGSTRGSRR